MNLLREYIRKVLLTEQSDRFNMFMSEMQSSFETRSKGTLAEVFPDGCEVRLAFKGHVDLDTVWFDFIETVDAEGKESTECYRKGYARSVMEKVNSKADMLGITLELEIGAFGVETGAAEDEDLSTFYKSVGFKDGLSLGMMVREPQ